MSAREEAGSSAKATVIVVCGRDNMVVVGEQEQLRTGHGQPLFVHGGGPQ